MTPADTPAWRALAAHAEAVRPLHLRELFAAEADRFANFSLAADGLFLDFSKQRVDARTMELLRTLAAAADIDGWRARMFAGETINHTEGRAVRHVA
jgi:glucose-6-phosphate isomerase